MEKQAKDFELKSDLEKASEIRYWKILELQKKLESNNLNTFDLQKKSGIIIKNTVEKEDIALVISQATWIPLAKLQQKESSKLINLQEHLSNKIIWQDQAVKAISDAILRARAWLKDPNKPTGSFLFLWPTWVGKTLLAKALAKFLFDDEKSMIRLDMSEYMEKQATARLVGAPPWYVWYEEWWQLTEAVRTKPYSVILLDEVEKAHPDIFNLLLQVFDDGRLTDWQWRTVDFKNTIIIMTSNIGSDIIMEKLQESDSDQVFKETKTKIIEEENLDENPVVNKIKRKRRRKPKAQVKIESPSDLQDQKIQELKEELDPYIKDFFRPEFLNRLDDNIIFNPISPAMLKKIVDIELENTLKLIFTQKSISMIVEDWVKNFLAKKWRDPAMWARPLKRAIQNYLINPLSKEIISWNIVEWDTVNIKLENDKLTFQN